ncbi:MAG: hypothetical protein AB7Y46_05085 [Armatimonadota bacterium]
MDSAIVTDSLTDAWQRTRGLLFMRPDAGRWLKLAFIALLGSSAARGSISYCRPSAPPTGQGGGPPGLAGPPDLQSAARLLAWLADNLAALIAVAIGLLVLWLALSLAVLYMRSVFRFIFIEAVAAPREPAVGASWGRHAGRGLSLLLWYLALGLLGMGLVVQVLVALVGGVALVANGEPLPALLGVSGIIALMLVALLVGLMLALLQTLTEDFLVPAMYARGCGVWEGWRAVRRAWRGQFWSVVLYYLLRLVLGVGAAIASALVGLFSLVVLVIPGMCLTAIAAGIAAAAQDSSVAVAYLVPPAGLAVVVGVLVYAYLLQVLLLPISVFFQAWALSFIGRLDASLRTLGPILAVRR